MTPPRLGFAVGVIALRAAAGAQPAAAPDAPGPIAIAALLDAAKGKEATDAFRKIASRYRAGQDPKRMDGPERTPVPRADREALEKN